jgi:hypothetical protein
MKMVMIRVGEHLFTQQIPKKSQAKPTPLDCFSEQLVKIIKIKIDALGYTLTVLCSSSQVDK